ncbi:MAG: 2-phosphosulfolactate phosphatase [Myxococcales bacterium]|jgi:2-phosphosulfolactate phosphatase
MRIERLSLRAGAEAARGTAVIIDVFRAFTCEPLMLALGAERIVLEADIDRCLARTGALRVGEQNELPIEGFDLTNSPWLILQAGEPFFRGRTVVHRTTSGVTGALTALERCEEVLLASFLNTGAVARYLARRRPPVVSIVAMGIRSSQPAPEDERCGDDIESRLCGKPYDHLAAVREILAHETAQKFLRGDKPYLPREDVTLCLQRDAVDWVLRAERDGQDVVARRVEL